MPQRRPAAGVSSRQQQGPRGAFPEPRGEQRRAAHLCGDDRIDLVGVEDEQFSTRWCVAGVGGRLRNRVGQPHHDAVVGGGRLLIDAVAVTQPPAHRQRKRTVHPQAVGGVQDHPPVAQLVAEPLDQQRGVGGHHRRGGALVVQQPPEVLGGVVIESQCSATTIERTAIQAGQLAGERAYRAAEFGGASGIIAAPERKSGGLARRRDHQHAVMGDLGDAPAGGP